MPVPWWSRRLWGAHVIGLLLLAAAILLGYWQLSVWQDHRAASRVDLTHEKPKPLDDVLGSDSPFPTDGVGRPVTVSGQWVDSGTVYVSGREHHGVKGYWVVTPVAVGTRASDPAIAVVRGWVRAVADAPAPPTGSVTLTGWLQPGEAETVDEGDDPSDDVLPQMRIADLLQHVDQDLYGGFVIDKQAGAGLVRADLNQLPKSDSGAGLRNFLYAMQWWLFGGFAIVMWWKYVQELRFPQAESGDGPEGPPEEGEEGPEHDPDGGAGRRRVDGSGDGPGAGLDDQNGESDISAQERSVASRS